MSKDLTCRGTERIRPAYQFGVEARALKFGRMYDYEFIRKDGKYFLVSCVKCGNHRTIKRLNTPTKCACSVKKVNPTFLSTCESITDYVRSIGHVAVECTQVETIKTGKSGADKKVLYWKCANGHLFTANIGKFRTWVYSCPECRDLENLSNRRAYSSDTLKERCAELGIRPINKVVALRDILEFEYISCGHRSRLQLGGLPKKSSRMRPCRTCYPRRGQCELTVCNKHFRLRSKTELMFLEKLLELGYSPDEIAYEPADGRVEYAHPVSGSLRTYQPDFKVRNTYIEVKDLNSLGIGHGYLYGSNHQVLLENRTKNLAAKKALGKFKTFCMTRRGEFYLTDMYWTDLERQRLRDLNRMRSRSAA